MRTAAKKIIPNADPQSNHAGEAKPEASTPPATEFKNGNVFGFPVHIANFALRVLEDPAYFYAWSRATRGDRDDAKGGQTNG